MKSPLRKGIGVHRSRVFRRFRVNLTVPVEPLAKIPSWTAFRTNRWVAGAASAKITTRVSWGTVVLPFVISGAALLVFHQQYPSRLWILDWSNVLLQATFVVIVLLMAVALSTGITLARYSTNELYRPPVPATTTAAFEGLLSRLYAQISPGVVRQPSSSA